MPFLALLLNPANWKALLMTIVSVIASAAIAFTVYHLDEIKHKAFEAQQAAAIKTLTQTSMEQSNSIKALMVDQADSRAREVALAAQLGTLQDNFSQAQAAAQKTYNVLVPSTNNADVTTITNDVNNGMNDFFNNLQKQSETPDAK